MQSSFNVGGLHVKDERVELGLLKGEEYAMRRCFPAHTHRVHVCIKVWT
jgi:hypothetical protein